MLLRLALRIGDRKQRIATQHRLLRNREHCTAPGVCTLAIHGIDTVACVQAGVCGQTLRHINDGQEIRPADHEHRPERGHGEQDIEYRAGNGDRHALPHGRGAVFAGLVCDELGIVRLARVEEFHIAAQRDRADRVFDAVFGGARPDRLAKADRKAQHLDPAATRDPVVAKLVEGDQQAEGDQ